MKTFHVRKIVKEGKPLEERLFEERKLGIQDLGIHSIINFSKGELLHFESAQGFHSSFPKKTQVPLEIVPVL